MNYQINLNDRGVKKLLLIATFAPCLIFTAGFMTAATHYSNLAGGHQQADTTEVSARANTTESLALIADSNPETIIATGQAEALVFEMEEAVAAQPSGEYSVQVAAFKNEPNALSFAAHLQDRGYPAEVIHLIPGEATPLYRVVYGHFEQREQAHLEASTFTLREKTKALIMERS
jgi:cell division septation protein DedD